MTRAPSKAYSFRAVGGVFFLTIALGIATGAVIYFQFLRYTRVAARHVPPDSDAVVRVEVEKVVLFEPFRKYLLPIVDCAGKPTMKPSRHERIQARSRVELAVDLREMVYAQAGGREHWVVLLGGMFPKSGVVAGVAKVLREEGRQGSVADGAWVDAEGWALAQADDGVLILASSIERARAALPAGEGARSLALPLDGAVGIALSEAGLSRTLRTAGVEPIDGLSGVTSELALSGDVTGHARLTMLPGADPKVVRSRVEAALKGIPARPEGFGEARLAGEARVIEQPGALGLEFPWEHLDVDRGGAKLHALLSERLCGGGVP
jgi:hypothetical protein